MRLVPFKGRLALSLALTLGVIPSILSTSADAQVDVVGNHPVVGSSNPIAADQVVPRPTTTSCKVTLFSNQVFADFNTKNFKFTPPAACPGPWSKVVFSADFTVTQGRQFDRTAEFFLGGANIYFGTTAEPRAKLKPSWHVESDVTKLSTLFTQPQVGTAILGNFVGVSGGVTYNGLIYANAHLVFYQTSDAFPAAITPDVVIGMPGNSGAASLNTTADQLTQSVTLPKNVERAYLDVIAQSQGNDEFWYTCVPSDQAGPLDSCSNTAFRETEVSIDGVPAGVAPIYPWIYTGGIDPYLWEPIPGVQTLNFKPYRVNLTPFAGLLSDGKPHTVAISVFNANSSFSVTGTLLAFTDKNAQQVFGTVISNTLATAPKPKVSENIVTDSSGNITGSVGVTSKRKYSITGATTTSHGVILTTVEGDIDFSNVQNFVIDATEYKQAIDQSTTGTVTTITDDNGKISLDVKALTYPFTFLIDEIAQPDGTITQLSTSDQQDVLALGSSGVIPLNVESVSHTQDKPSASLTSNEVKSTDTLIFDSSFNLIGHVGNSSTQNYVTTSTSGYCFSRMLNSKNNKLTSFTDGAACILPAKK